LAAAWRHAVQARHHQVGEVRARLAQRSPQTRIETASHALLSLWKRLQAASPASVLNRGFVMLRDEAGQPIVRRAQVRSGQRLAVEFGDGATTVRAE
jgi:exodeoxyribonuclease VII large subunit